jgi:hypothetical protein
MADDGVTLRGINWRDTFPFTHLFRAFRVAVHPSKIVLALVLLGCLWCGGLVLDAIWPHKYQVTATESVELVGSSGTLETYHPGRPAVRERWLNRTTEELGVFETFFAYEIAQANNVLMFRGAQFASIWNFVITGPLWLWARHPLFALIYSAWFLFVWSVLGGAIGRIAAVHVARDEKISVRQALTFSAGKILSFIFAPVIPVLIILGIGVVIAGVSWVLLHIPYAGPILVGLLFFLALLGGFVITLVTLGTLGGFNLMYPTVAVEGSDSFDAISRSFSYVFARPWRMLWYTLVSIVYGAICYLFVRFFVWMLLSATWFFVNWFLNGQPRTYWPMMWPGPSDPLLPLPYTPSYDNLKWSEAVGAGLVAWWVYLVIGLIGAFAISFYFSANTIIYYLMRREVDATELDDVYVEETEDDVDEGAGAAAAAPGGTTPVAESTTVRVYQTPDAPGGATPTSPGSSGSTGTPAGESTPPAGEAPPA